MRRLRHLLLLLCIALALTPAGSALAADELLIAPIRSDGRPDPVVDAADLLSADDEETLRTQIDALRAEWDFDVVLVTVNGTGSRTATQYADDFYDTNGYGLDDEHSGILLLVDMGDRAWATSTAGRGTWIFTDATLYSLEDRVITNLSAAAYQRAFLSYVTVVSNTLESALRQRRFAVTNLLLCLVIGFLLALIPLFLQLRRLNNVRQAAGADGYRLQGGLKLRVQNDQFLRHVVTTTPIPQPQQRSGGGGGSITHTSFAGVSHGGHSGHF